MVLPFETITQSAAQTQKLGEAFGNSFLKGEVSHSEIPLRGRSREVPRVVCLWGELGSGKTTFVRGLAKGLGITSRLLSPTFIIVRRHDIPETTGVLYHLDLYRIVSSESVAGVGFTDMIREPKSLVVIEWPERLGKLLPERYIDIRFATRDDGSHKIRGISYG